MVPKEGSLKASLREKLQTQCPEAYSAVIANNGMKEEEEDDEYDAAIKAKKVQADEDRSSTESSKNVSIIE